MWKYVKKYFKRSIVCGNVPFVMPKANKFTGLYSIKVKTFMICSLWGKKPADQI